MQVPFTLPPGLAALPSSSQPVIYGAKYATPLAAADPHAHFLGGVAVTAPKVSDAKLVGLPLVLGVWLSMTWSGSDVLWYVELLESGGKFGIAQPDSLITGLAWCLSHPILCGQPYAH